MAGLDKPTARISVLGRDNWSTWKEKSKALLVYKSLYVSIESPESVEGRKASDQTRSGLDDHAHGGCICEVVCWDGHGGKGAEEAP
jgi:hypothetical protein